MKPRILIADDDYGVAETLKGLAAACGCEAEAVYNGEDALTKVNEGAPFDLVILDWMMPKLDGLEVCRRLKDDIKTRDMPVIMLTGKSSADEEVDGLKSGADDYITKPFDLNVVKARIELALKKSRREKTLTIGEITVNTDRHEALVKEKPVRLTPNEFDLLYFFMSNEGKALSRDVLSEEIWGYKHLKTTRAIDETVKCLRKKLGSCGKKIETVTGLGYKFKA